MKNHVLTIDPERIVDKNLWTWANILTVARTVVGLAVLSIAAFQGSDQWNFAGLAIYWVFDSLDGIIARVFDQETRFGAQIDILSDRLLAAFFYINYLVMHPHLVVPIAIFLFEFMFLDHYLSNQFIRWPILSPNYFYKVDRQIWRLNWSAPAKSLNGGLVPLLLFITQSPWPALPVLAVLIGLKTYSCVRLHRLPPPERGGFLMINTRASAGKTV